MNKSTIAILTNIQDCLQISKDQLKKHGTERTIFLTVMIDYQNKPRMKQMKDGSFHLTIREIASMTGMTLNKIKTCIKYWKEKGILDIFKGGIPYRTYYKINLEKIENPHLSKTKNGGF